MTHKAKKGGYSKFYLSKCAVQILFLTVEGRITAIKAGKENII